MLTHVFVAYGQRLVVSHGKYMYHIRIFDSPALVARRLRLLGIPLAHLFRVVVEKKLGRTIPCIARGFHDIESFENFVLYAN